MKRNALSIYLIISVITLFSAVTIPLMMNAHRWDILTKCISDLGVYENSRLIFSVLFTLSTVPLILWVNEFANTHRKYKGIMLFKSIFLISLLGLIGMAWLRIERLETHLISVIIYVVFVTLSMLISSVVFRNNWQFFSSSFILFILASVVSMVILYISVSIWGDRSFSFAELFHSTIILIWLSYITVLSNRNLL